MNTKNLGTIYFLGNFHSQVPEKRKIGSFNTCFTYTFIVKDILRKLLLKRIIIIIIKHCINHVKIAKLFIGFKSWAIFTLSFILWIYTYRLRTRISFSNESSLPLSAFLSMTLIAYRLPDSLFSANRTWEKAPLYSLMVMVMHSIQPATKVEVFHACRTYRE